MNTVPQPSLFFSPQYNPKTPVDAAAYLIDELDGILLLSSEPDGRGENFLQATVQKISQVRSLSPTVPIWVDGGVTKELLSELHAAGATHAVMGRAFFAGKL